MCKLHDFSITNILREINFGDSRSAKSTILTHLKTLEFDFYELKCTKLTKFSAPKMAKTAILQLQHPPKLVSRKMTEKS